MSSKKANGTKPSDHHDKSWSDVAGRIKLALEKLDQDADFNLAKMKKKGDDIRSHARDMEVLARVVGRKD